MGNFGGSSAPLVYRSTGPDIRDSLGVGSPYEGLPLEIVTQIGQDGVSGIQYYFNHFHQWEGPPNAQSVATVGGWKASQVDGGNDDLEAIAVSSAQYGILQIGTNDADGDNVQLALTGASFKYVPGKRMWCHGRFGINDVDAALFAFGLASVDADWFDTLPVDGIFFEKGETALDLDLHGRKNGTSTEKTAALGLTLANNTFFTAGFSVDELGNVIPFLNGVPQLGKVIAKGDANLPDDALVQFAMQIETGTTSPAVLNVDWLTFGQER